MKDPAIQIATNRDGSFSDVSLRDCELVRVVEAGGDSWTDPILLAGPDAGADIDALKRARNKHPWVDVRAFRDVAGKRRAEFEVMEQRFDTRFYDHAPTPRNRLNAILRGDEPLEALIEFVSRGPSADGYLSRSSVGLDFADHVERLCSTVGLILPWQMRNSILPAFVLAVWSQHARLFPLILHCPRRFGVPRDGSIEVSTGGIAFDTLAIEAERAFGITRPDVEKAYRVWQLSRTADTTKPQATTPRRVSLDIAREFLGVVSRARTERQMALIAAQKPAPLMFELDGASVGLRHNLSVRDDPDILKAGSASLRRRIDRLLQDVTFANVVPSSGEMLSFASAVLEKVVAGQSTDGDIVELGLEFHALQWHVDAVKVQLAEITVGELTGLFATASLFLNRFSAWKDFSDTHGEAASDCRDAAFEVAHELLAEASKGAGFLTSEATARIGALLERTPLTTDEPPLREGLVLSGENLAAVTAEGLSKVVVDQESQSVRTPPDRGYRDAKAAIVGFASANSELLDKFGKLRKWPWLGWLRENIR